MRAVGTETWVQLSASIDRQAAPRCALPPVDADAETKSETPAATNSESVPSPVCRAATPPRTAARGIPATSRLASRRFALAIGPGVGVPIDPTLGAGVAGAPDNPPAGPGASALDDPAVGLEVCATRPGDGGVPMDVQAANSAASPITAPARARVSMLPP